MEILLQHIDLKAILSLEPIFVLIGVLARDLQADFLPYIPQIFTAYSNLVDDGVSFLHSPFYTFRPYMRSANQNLAFYAIHCLRVWRGLSCHPSDCLSMHACPQSSMRACAAKVGGREEFL